MSSNKTWYTGKLRQLNSMYNPEHDLDNGNNPPPVTWREKLLADLILELAKQLDEMEERIKALEGWDNDDQYFGL